MIDDMAVYIANLGKYNEGYLVGAWFTFPIDEEDVKEKIGLNEQYEEYAIYNIPITVDTRISVVPTFRTPSPFVSLFINTPLSNTFFLDTLFQM